MPELPEVELTARGLDASIRGATIADVWTDYRSDFALGKEDIKDPAHFALLRRRVRGRKILRVERRAKNILIRLDGDLTILVHMKMTGHFLVGRFARDRKANKWIAPEGPMRDDPYNRHVRFALVLDDGRVAALSDMRRFAKIALVAGDPHVTAHLADLGPEPLDAAFTFPVFKTRLLRRGAKAIKAALLDQSSFVGVGNIYSDEALWRAGIHPESRAADVDDAKLRALWRAVREVLARGVYIDDDPTAEYRRTDGLKSSFALPRRAYRRTGLPCQRKGCPGKIERRVVNGRSAHFCPVCQPLPKKKKGPQVRASGLMRSRGKD
jgi:formamidopyrimidine-DNA glycosylase